MVSAAGRQPPGLAPSRKAPVLAWGGRGEPRGLKPWELAGGQRAEKCEQECGSEAFWQPPCGEGCVGISAEGAWVCLPGGLGQLPEGIVPSQEMLPCRGVGMQLEAEEQSGHLPSR